MYKTYLTPVDHGGWAGKRCMTTSRSLALGHSGCRKYLHRQSDFFFFNDRSQKMSTFRSTAIGAIACMTVIGSAAYAQSNTYRSGPLAVGPGSTSETPANGNTSPSTNGKDTTPQPAGSASKSPSDGSTMTSPGSNDQSSSPSGSSSSNSTPDNPSGSSSSNSMPDNNSESNSANQAPSSGSDATSQGKNSSSSGMSNKSTESGSSTKNNRIPAERDNQR